MIETTEWFQDGACYSLGNTQLFYSVNKRDISQAKAICRGCSISYACGAYAISKGEFGIWGGLTESERSIRSLFSPPTAEQIAASLRNKPREPNHLASESQVSQGYNECSQTRTLQALSPAPEKSEASLQFCIEW